jgi:hypothetical protein
MEPRLSPDHSPMSLLEQGIPLSLLMDLVCGPDSADLMNHERLSQEWTSHSVAQ